RSYPTASWSTAPTASTCSSRCTSAACVRSPPWYAAPPWRTSSSGSPGGRWWTDGDHRGPGRPRRRPAVGLARHGQAVRLLRDDVPAHLEVVGDQLVRRA